MTSFFPFNKNVQLKDACASLKIKETENTPRIETEFSRKNLTNAQAISSVRPNTQNGSVKLFLFSSPLASYYVLFCVNKPDINSLRKEMS